MVYHWFFNWCYLGVAMKNDLPDYEVELLDACWEEMTLFSGLDTGFIENLLQLAETDDDIYEEVCKWFKSENTAQRRYHEEQMTNILQRNNRL